MDNVRDHEIDAVLELGGVRALAEDGENDVGADGEIGGD